jgi:hypothetical protein
MCNDWFKDWTASTSIALIGLAISLVTAFFLVRNFYLGRKMTGISVSINQFNIYYKELEGFIKEAKDMKFVSKKPELLKSYEERYRQANGISYINIFPVVKDVGFYEAESAERQAIIDDFRNEVIYPLFKFYDRLRHYLERIDDDSILSAEYKDILFNYVERDLLQDYLRITNHRAGGQLWYDLTLFETPVFDQRIFYRINEFYISHEAFQFKDLAFYQRTL